MQKNALISGLNGFTGQYMSRKLVAEGYSVFGLGSHAANLAGYYQVDLQDQARLLGVVNQVKPSVVVHLAASHTM
jgi:GDP-D-mannose dehydratase